MTVAADIWLACHSNRAIPITLMMIRRDQHSTTRRR